MRKCIVCGQSITGATLHVCNLEKFIETEPPNPKRCAKCDKEIPYTSPAYWDGRGILCEQCRKGDRQAQPVVRDALAFLLNFGVLRVASDGFLACRVLSKDYASLSFFARKFGNSVRTQQDLNRHEWQIGNRKFFSYLAEQIEPVAPKLSKFLKFYVSTTPERRRRLVKELSRIVGVSVPLRFFVENVSGTHLAIEESD